MSENTKIEWAEATWNPLAGCSIVSPGCHNCYAMRTAHRLAAMGQEKYQGVTEKKNGRIVWTGDITLHHASLDVPLKKKKPTVWFVNSMSDLFHESVPFEFIYKVFAVMEKAHWHTFQVLTKRSKRMMEFLGGTSGAGLSAPPLPNVWLGTSCEDQQRADERIPHLLNCPAAVRFVSAEPLLGELDLVPYLRGSSYQCSCGFHMTMKKLVDEYETGYSCVECGESCRPGPTIDLVITGGESGPKARPMHPAWPLSIRDQCVDANVSFFFKQWGEWGLIKHRRSNASHVIYCDGRHVPFDKESILAEERRSGKRHDRSLPHTIFRVGKKKAGRLLDGRTWNELPQVT